MIKIFKGSPVLAVAIGVNIVLLNVDHAYAVETAVANRQLITTAIKTNDTPVHFSESSTPAFSTTTISCSVTNCTIRVEVSSQFANIVQPAVVAAAVTVDNSQNGVLPGAVIGLDVANTTSGSSTARTFSWMKTGLTPGQHTVDVAFFSTQAEADAVNRTLTIQLYK